MSRTIPPALLAHLAGETATTAICWCVERRDGVFIRCTDHDEDIEVPSGSPSDDLQGIYYAAAANITGSDITSAADMSPDNMDVEGFFARNPTINDVTAAQIEGGLFNKAACTIILLNWANPLDGFTILQHGILGEIERDSDGRYRTELRGLQQFLSQQIMRTYSERCDVVRFGQGRCQLNIVPLTITATVTAVESTKRFTVSGITTQAPGYFSLGMLRGLTGANAGFEREVKWDDYNGQHGRLELWDKLPSAVLPGDTFALEPGCDRRFTTCKNVHGNQVNFQGCGHFMPGVMALLKGPAA